MSTSTPLSVLQDYVLLKELKPEEKTESGILLLEDVDRERNQGIVVGKGDTCKLPIEIGDRVLVRSYGFDDVEIKGEKYFFGKEENIIGKLS